MTRLALALALAALAPATARGDDPDYEIRVAPELAVAANATGSLSVAIVPSGRRTVSSDGPVRVAVDAPPGLVVPRRRYTRKDAADPAADAPRFDIRVRGKDPGEHAVTLDLRFWLCGPRLCRPIATTRRVLVRVSPP